MDDALLSSIVYRLSSIVRSRLQSRLDSYYAGVVRCMQPWAVEDGTLWALETGGDLPPMCPARVKVEFKEMGRADVDDLAVAMNLPTSQPIRQRLQSNPRCFSLSAAGQ